MVVYLGCFVFFFFFSSRRRHTRSYGDWSSDVCSSDLLGKQNGSSQSAKCFRHLRFGQMLGNQLDTLVVPIRRETLQEAVALAVAIRTGELRDDRKGGQA